MGQSNNGSLASTPAKRIEAFKKHLIDVARAFNEATKAHGLGVTISAEAAIRALDGGIGTKRADEFVNGVDESGILHEEQIVTAVAAIERVVNDKERNGGLIKGAMQAGKTTASLAMQLMAPIYYLLTGKPLYPFYLLTVHTSQREQTFHELTKFLGFYSNLTFHKAGGFPQGINEDFAHAKTLESYRDFVLHAAAADSLFSQVMKPEDYVETRAPGHKIKRIAERMKKIVDSGFVALMIIDEPQFGVMDHYDEKAGEMRESVFKRIFRAIEEKLNMPRGTHAFIGTSATPYEMHDVEGIWVVSQKLGPTYRGFNIFAGETIDETADCKPPEIHSLGEFAKITGATFLENFNLSALDKPNTFYKLRGKMNVPEKMTHGEYYEQSIKALRDALVWLAKKNPGQAFGVCVRARNNNNFARTLELELRLGRVYETLQYNGEDARDRSVKHLLATRKRPGDPYLLFVTNRARMGDAFPKSAKYFIELAEKFTDMNAMFQGFVGRACGYDKETEIVLSDWNAMMLRTVVAVKGRYVFKTSRGSTIVGTKRRGRPASQLTIRRDGDTRVDKFFKRLDQGFLKRRLMSDTGATLSTKRSGKHRTNDFKYAPLFTEANRLKLFEYVEDPSNRNVFAEGFPDFRIVRENEKITTGSVLEEAVGYSLDSEGGCEVIIREFSADLQQGGVRGRGASSGKDGAEQQDVLMPQIIMRKYDAKTNRPIDDKGLMKRRPGVWKAYAITVPLEHPVSPVIAAPMTLPIKGTVFYDTLNASEKRAVRGVGPAAKAAKQKGRPR